MLMPLALKDPLIGFLAAAIAVVIAHEVIVFLLNTAGILPVKPWSTEPVGPYHVPKILNSIFWGGLWGVVYALIQSHLPGAQAWERGLIFGILIALISNFTLLALIKGQPLFAGYDGKRIVAVLLILGGFGAATGILYEKLRTII
jgi:hypothetical protein